MAENSIFGYAGHLLRVDLSRRKAEKIPLDREFTRKFIGGSGFGAKYLYDEVHPGTEWFDEGNRVILATGPLGGSSVSGTGTFSVVSKGPMTGHAGSTQASGFFGAYLKFAGFDGIILEGRSEDPTYLVFHDGEVDFKDADHLWGMDTIQTEETIRKDGKFKNEISAYCIGPAAENGVLFSLLCGDQGHVASKNGMGAVLASKNLKAVVAEKGNYEIPIHDQVLLRKLAKELLQKARTNKGGVIHRLGTAGIVSNLHMAGILPVKNYTTNIFPSHSKINGETLRSTMKLKPKHCWRCGLRHLHYVTVKEGPYAGFEAEEPDYECIAAFGPLIGQDDLGAIVMLSDLVDRLGMDANETGWAVSWVIECFEKGLFSKEDTDGLEMTWGNVEAVRSLIIKISRKEGIGDLLSEGVMRAAEKVGGEARDCAVYTKKGATPRGHDHRARWSEMMDTCLSTTSTLEATSGGGPRPELFGWPPVKDPFNPEEVVDANVMVNGYRLFEDSLGVCNFNSVNPPLAVECVNAITGWDFNLSDAINAGLSTLHRLRMFNLRHGQDISLEAPSKRYSSAPSDGPCNGKSIFPHWEKMRRSYYEKMGWNLETGWPLEETLSRLELDDLITDLPSSFG